MEKTLASKLRLLNWFVFITTILLYAGVYYTRVNQMRVLIIGNLCFCELLFMVGFLSLIIEKWSIYYKYNVHVLRIAKGVMHEIKD